VAPLAGSRRVEPPTEGRDDRRLRPGTWKTTTVRIGQDFGELASLHFIQDLQLPGPRLPYVNSLTFYAPVETPLVTIGIYYEKSADNAQVREILTSSAFVLQRIVDPDSPLRFDAQQLISDD
jgi:hypothetical protein